MYTTCSELGIFMYRTRNSMNNLLSYCGLVDRKIRGSDKDLPVLNRVKELFAIQGIFVALHGAISLLEKKI